jgi:hypothetical protein
MIEIICGKIIFIDPLVLQPKAKSIPLVSSIIYFAVRPEGFPAMTPIPNPSFQSKHIRSEKDY